MEQHGNCVLCQGLHCEIFHILIDDLPRTRPLFAAYIQDHAVLKVVFNNTQSVCHPCWERVEKEVRPYVLEVEQDRELQVLDYVRAANNPRHCIFNNCLYTNLNRIPEKIKVHILCEYKIYIPDRARVCREHLESNVWDQLPQFCNVSRHFNAQQFTDICDVMRILNI